jgi:hypothetical protein
MEALRLIWGQRASRDVDARECRRGPDRQPDAGSLLCRGHEKTIARTHGDRAANALRGACLPVRRGCMRKTGLTLQIR